MSSPSLSYGGWNELLSPDPVTGWGWYRGPIEEEALARLHFLVSQRRRLGLVVGDHGMGKTTLLHVFRRELARSGAAVAMLSLQGIDAQQLLWRIAADLGIQPALDEGTRHLWRRLSDWLVAHRLLDRRAVILLDDGDAATRQIMSHVVRLAQGDGSPDCPLTLVLASHTRGLPRLGARLIALTSLRTDLGPWDESDTVAHLQSALIRAAEQGPAMEEDALVRVHELARGVPRRVNQLAGLALLAGAVDRLDRIDSRTIDSVCGQFGAALAPVSAHR